MSRSTVVIVSPATSVGRLLTAASELDGRVAVLVVGTEQQAREAAAAGVDEVRWFECAGDVPAEAYAPAVAKAAAQVGGVVLAGRDPASRVLLGAAAAELLAPVVVGVTGLSVDGETTLVAAGVYGGVARRTTAYTGPVALVLEDGGEAPVTEAVVPVAAQPDAPLAIRVTATEPDRKGSADLGSAARVVGVGRGLKAREDLESVEALAGALGAEVGCTRPLSEGLEWLSRDRYIGISGQHIAPQLYLAVGISGQLQHMAGVREAGTIVAINTDGSAPIAQEADYLLVGDLYQLVPAITAALG